MARILAVGAFLKSEAGLWQDGAWQASPQHGDLRSPQACAALEDSIHALVEAANGPIDAVAHDLHPDFPSTRLALATADALGIPAVGVQHHHAHAGAVMAEIVPAPTDEPVLALTLDGHGIGPDDDAWGGELLVMQGSRWDRLGHLRPLRLPGGERAAEQPWRMTAAAMHAMGQGSAIVDRFAPVVGETAAAAVAQMLQRGLHAPETTSAGRWFDAAAGALGVSVQQSHEAEAAMALEALAHSMPPRAPVPVEAIVESGPDGMLQLDLRPVLAWLLSPAAHADLPAAAHAFHAALGDALVQACAHAAGRLGARRVLAGGGCWLNRRLRERVAEGLGRLGLVLHVATSPADAGLARGQAWCVEQALKAGPMPPTLRPRSAAAFWASAAGSGPQGRPPN